MAFWCRAGLTMGLGIALFLTGCGGGGSHGNTTNTANTGSNAGTLADLLISPAPGSTFISKSTTFRLVWTDGATPPPTFTVTLQRYKEANDTTAGSISAQKTDLNREGDTYAWDLSRSDGFTLDQSAVYYVEIDSGSEQVLASYIVSGERSEKIDATRAAEARAQTEPIVGNSALVHIVHP